MGSVLVVEADPGIGEAWTRALGSAGHEVHSVANVRDALTCVRDGGLDVIVIDSYDNRASVLELVQSLDLLPDSPPLILVSGSPTAPELSARIGAAGFVPKPCEPDELVAEVQRIAFAVRTSRPSMPLMFDAPEPEQLARGTGDVDLASLPTTDDGYFGLDPEMMIDTTGDDRLDAVPGSVDDEPTGPILR